MIIDDSRSRTARAYLSLSFDASVSAGNWYFHRRSEIARISTFVANAICERAFAKSRLSVNYFLLPFSGGSAFIHYNNNCVSTVVQPAIKDATTGVTGSISWPLLAFRQSTRWTDREFNRQQQGIGPAYGRYRARAASRWDACRLWNIE